MTGAHIGNEVKVKTCPVIMRLAWHREHFCLASLAPTPVELVQFGTFCLDDGWLDGAPAPKTLKPCPWRAPSFLYSHTYGKATVALGLDCRLNDV